MNRDESNQQECEDKDYAITIKHTYNEQHDRWIYIEYNKINKIIGLNYMHGDDYEFFKDNFAKLDRGLTEFYKEMLYTFPIECAGVDTMQFINKCMWAYNSALNLNHTHKTNTKSL